MHPPGKLRFASLGSGSRGNATLIEFDGTLLMVDCGFTLVETVRRMARLDRHPRDLAGILVTHEHGDHVSGLGPLARAHGVPVWLSAGSRAGLRDKGLPVATEIVGGEPFTIGAIEVEPVPVIHDAREPIQFVFSDGARRLGVLTDVGEVDDRVRQGYSSLDAFLLESNHDLEMLAAGPYSNRLKKRVGGRYGHLNNGQAADLLREVDTSRLQHIVAAHISEKNNTPDLARTALADALDLPLDRVGAAHQTEGLGWLEVA